MSAKLNLYNRFREKMGELSCIKESGIWNEQITEENEPNELVHQFPAAYIEFSNIVWGRKQQPLHQGAYTNIRNQQTSSEETEVTIHVCFSHLERENDSFAQIDAVLDLVQSKLEGLEGDLFSNFQRIQELQPTNHNRVIIWPVIYKTSFIDLGTLDEDLILSTLTGITFTTDLIIDPNTVSGVRSSGYTS